MYPCPVCSKESYLYDVVDLHKSCEENRGLFLPLSGRAIYYAKCEHCGFVFAPEMHAWSLEEFGKLIYNEDYVKVDPDYVEIRPRQNANTIAQMFASNYKDIRHLDYGGGDGLFSQVLQSQGWDSVSWDPFYQTHEDLVGLGKFDLITAFEVFEHVPDVGALITTLNNLLSEDGLILFSTLVSDGVLDTHGRINWWYAAPRNGHISLFTYESLKLLGELVGLQFVTFSKGFHMYCRHVPDEWQHYIYKNARTTT